MYLFYDCLSLRCSRQADGSLYTLITLVLVVGRPQTELKIRPPSPTAASHALSVALTLRSADSLNTCAAALPHWSCHHFKMIFCLKRPRAEGPQCNTSVRMTVLLLQQCRLGFEMRERERERERERSVWLHLSGRHEDMIARRKHHHKEILLSFLNAYTHPHTHQHNMTTASAPVHRCICICLVPLCMYVLVSV